MNGAQDARAAIELYLNKGAPFYGEIPRAQKAKGVKFDKAAHERRKERAKDEGIVWRKNPDYVEGSGWGGPPMGWHVAMTEQTLETVLRAPPSDELPIWRPNGISNSDIALMRIMLEQRRAAADKADAQMRTRKGPSDEQREREERARLGVPLDSEEEKAELLRLGIVHSTELMSKSKRFVSTSGMTLGPRSGISDAARLLRGLSLDLLTVEEAKTCAVAVGTTNGPPSARLNAARKRSVDAHDAEAKRIKRDIVFDDQDDDCPDGDDAAINVTHTERAFLPIVGPIKCPRCHTLVMGQFMDCSCAFPHNTWQVGIEMQLVNTALSQAADMPAGQVILKPTFVRCVSA